LPPVNAYLLAKQIHQAAAAVTLALFVLRGAWMLLDSPHLQRRWVKIVPHVNDTVLLAAALYLAFAIGLQAWIAAKVAALVAYIVLGRVALKRGRTKGSRAAAFAAALVVFGYIVAVAFTKRPLPFA
jgi:uncharacterized membrane protein SirB2